MPRTEDDPPSLRALADDLILDMAERDPARVAGVIIDVCERLAAEHHYSRQELQTAVEALLHEWQERLSDRPTTRTQAQMMRTQDTALAFHGVMGKLHQ